MKNNLENFDELPKLTSAPSRGDRVAVKSQFGFCVDRRVGTVSAVLQSPTQQEHEWGVVVCFAGTKDSRATKQILPVGELRAVKNGI